MTKEGLAAMLASASVYVALPMLKSDRSNWVWDATLGDFLGLALLTKASALLVVPPIVGALLWKGLKDAKAVRSLASVFVSLGVCTLICGWCYLASWTKYGKPFFGNWDPESGYRYWLEDGYRTISYYCKFGFAL